MVSGVVPPKIGLTSIILPEPECESDWPVLTFVRRAASSATTEKSTSPYWFVVKDNADFPV